MSRKILIIPVVFTAILFYFPVYSDFSADTDAPTSINKTFIQSEIDAIEEQIGEINDDIGGLTLTEGALKAQVSIIQTQRLLDGLTARKNDLNSKISAAGKKKKKKTKTQEQMGVELAALNKEIAIRNEILALYKLQLGDDQNSQEARTGNVVYIQAQIKLRENEIAALYPAKAAADALTTTLPANGAAPALTPEDSAVQAFLDQIKIIDGKISDDRKKTDDLKKEEIPLTVQLKGMVQ
ncbi:MAG: hypothetical protein ABSA34_02000 [Candidatus Goldiibacteriota bacterium]|jgi:chromosome segregation ATPase